MIKWGIAQEIIDNYVANSKYTFVLNDFKI